ncbi:VanW family protein [Gordonia sp. CPCC 205333]|uniref:VanW family protein n=1 Tax=Gordonia sp. CPCC 205333 TaxID=3140790 RepID=UPI003AF3EBE1
MSRKKRGRRITRCALAVVLVLTLVLSIDLLATHEHSARGASIAGVEISNSERSEVRAAVDGLLPAVTAPVHLRTTSGSATLTARELGLSFDADATVEQAMKQPRGLWARLHGLFGRDHPVRPVITVDDVAFNAALDTKRKELEKAAVEGGVHFVTTGNVTAPVGDLPSAGLRINRAAAKDTVVASWLTGQVIDLPMESFSPTVSAATVQRAVDGPAKTYVSSAMRLDGRGSSVALTPAQLGEVAVFGPDGKGGLRPIVDPKKLARVAGSGLVKTESRPVNATFTLAAGAPKVVPSREGQSVDWVKTGQQLGVAGLETSARRGAVAYTQRKPALDTAKARGLGVKEVVSDFTTGGFSAASGENIRLVAQEVNGAIVLPGKNFSLNGYTGTRGTAQGYVDSTIIDHGRAAKAVGGGISQFATTLYNAAYFAGLEDVDHTEHAYYISRYPEAREATVFEGAIDLVFRNNTKSGIYIETQWTSSSVLVRFWSTKTTEVQSITGERYAYTDPSKIELPKGDDCMASSGQRGFTTSNTRVVTDAKTGAERSRHTRTVKYDPEPNVVCK